MTDEEIDAFMRPRTRRSLLTGALSLAGAALGWRYLVSRPEAEGLPGPLRRTLEGNGRLWSDLHRPEHPAPSEAPAAGSLPRVNGDVGLEGEADAARWRLSLRGKDGAARSLTLRDVRRLPRRRVDYRFKCIEGWSEPMTFEGARFSDLLGRYGLAPALYGGLETPGRGYYVSLDMASLLHPQTLLVYAMNGRPLASEHGAPLRLLTTVKYGIKSLKRVGTIRLSDIRPPDYWAERGYDWYAGL